MTTEEELGLTPLTEADLAKMAHLGISRRPIDSFSVGDFRYSNLGDAVAQANRQLSENRKPVP